MQPKQNLLTSLCLQSLSKPAPGFYKHFRKESVLVMCLLHDFMNVSGATIIK